MKATRVVGGVIASLAVGALITRSLRRNPGEHSGQGIEAYCLRCKTRRQIQDPRTVTTKNAKTGTKGSCAVCGAGIFSFAAKAA